MAEGENQSQPWHSTIAGEDLGFIQNRGWDKLEAPAAAVEAIKAYRAAASRLGAPPEELVRLPKDPNAPEWADVHKRLGRPDTAAEYDFSVVKNGDKPGLDDQMAATLRDAFHKANLPVSAAISVAQAIADHSAGVAKAAATEAQVTADAEMARLDAMWGPQKETNRFIAERAAQTLGISKEMVDGLVKTIGGANTMEGLRKLGVQMGEARHITGQGDESGKIVSAEQARERLTTLLKDEAWRQKFASNDSVARGEYDQLTRRIAEANLARR